MTDWAKIRLKEWVDELESDVFVTMDGIGSPERVRVTAEELLEHYPNGEASEELLDWLRERRPGGIYLVLRDKWAWAKKTARR
jgi:hypothetical protein